MALNHAYHRRDTLFILFFYLLVFETALVEYVSPIFTYVDELFALYGICMFFYQVSKTQIIRIKKSSLGIVLPLMIFVMTGLAGNIIYKYQSIGNVLKDLFANLKFYLSVASGYMLFRYVKPQPKTVLAHTRIITVFLFALLVIDRVVPIFPTSEYRYGFRITPLIYPHVTFLAGTCAFLLAIYLFYYEKNNLRYIVMTVILLVSTFRGKGLAGAVAYCVILYFIVWKQRKFKFWHYLVLILLSMYIAWDQLLFYYVDLAGHSARSVLTLTSFEILKDYFPIGTGFGTYASDVAGETYSVVYVKYGFRAVSELREGEGYFSDTFWPIIIGQTGFIGTVSYLTAMFRLFQKSANAKAVSKKAYGCVIFVFCYLLISSTSESAFNNSFSAPLAMMLGNSIYHSESTVV